VAGREHAVLISIVFKGAGFTNQPINHVPVIDPMFAVSMEPRHSIDLFLGIPDLKMFSAHVISENYSHGSTAIKITE
jgi:hypothetical protein